MMPLTDQEFDFLDAYVHEAYTPSMTGPHTQAVRVLGVRQSDLSWLLTAHYRQAQTRGTNPMGSPHPGIRRCPWESAEQVLARTHELQEELEAVVGPAAPEG